MDFGSGAAESATAVVVWPPPGATGVPRSFSGNEGPVVCVYFANGVAAAVTTHALRDAQGQLVAHTFVTPQDPTVGLFMANRQTFTREWSFTTQ
jgi:hypothetical protein